MDVIIVLSLLIGCLVKHSETAACTGNNPIGVNNPSNNNLDPTSALTVLMDHTDFTISCCGIIDSWEFYAKSNTGTVYLQAWRSSGGTYNLVGENAYAVTTTAPSFTNADVTVSYADTTAIGTTMHTVAVNTPDAGDTITTIELSNTNPSMFQFDTSTMIVSTKTAVSSGSYVLQFKATNGCQQSATGTLTISITNTAPVINNLPSSIDISEALSTETTLIVISTTDPTDTVSCSITNPATSPFDTKLSPGTSDNVDSTFTVYLLKNGPPSFTNIQNRTVISTSTAGNVVIFTVTATDSESDTLTYRFTCSSCPFTINSINSAGEIETSSVNMNYEDMSSAGGAGTTFTLTVYATDDKGGSVSKNLVITVIDINETPYFSQNVYGCHGNENTVGNTLSDPSISVVDPEGNTLVYRMDCGQYSGYFSMDSSTAAITVTQAYDRDLTTNPTVISCTTTASDGEFTATATVQITIDDVNDNTPAFSQSFYTFYISPTESVNTVIGTLPATDADAGNYGTLSYAINQTVLYSEYFGMTGSSLYVKSSLSSFTDGQIITIGAVVTDGGGLQDKTTVYLVMAETTTVSVTTTTTERFYTFFEDSRNTAWFTLFIIGFISVCSILGYILYKYFRTNSFSLKKDPIDPKNGENYKKKQAKVHKMWEPERNQGLSKFGCSFAMKRTLKHLKR
ncbi:hypothetical protein KUTeg_000071 [Tegillarca granosa]|uniref:Cadherin domain-containing protein n=1 Tax=Tegillarca granosa TaxID=220873 RepID=A0ABQ9G0V9_TEGGR|nr:hypothetical protein KUTeg_000071 [Tegillarca granosa]